MSLIGTSTTGTLNNVDLHWLRWGDDRDSDASKPRILCLHGAWGTAESFDTFGPVAGRDYRVAALDHRGHGRSAWTPGDYAPHRYGADVAAWCEAHAVTKIHVVGMSLGGLISLEFARTHAHLLASLVLVDIAPELNADAYAGLSSTLPYPEQFGSLDDAVAWASVDGLWPQGPGLRRTLETRLKHDEDGMWRWRADASFMDPASRALWFGPDTDLWTPFAGIEVPVRLLRAGKSPLVDDTIVARMRASNPHFSLVDIADAEHSIPFSHPDEFNNEILGFLAELSA